MRFLKIIPVTTLVILAVCGCQKHKTIYPTPVPTVKDYIGNIGGMRIWHGVQNHQCWGCTPTIDTTFDIADTFALTVLDSTNLIMPITPLTAYDTLYFVSANDSGNYLTFNIGPNLYYNGYLTYYYLTNSISISIFSNAGSETWATTLETP